MLIHTNKGRSTWSFDYIAKVARCIDSLVHNSNMYFYDIGRCLLESRVNFYDRYIIVRETDDIWNSNSAISAVLLTLLL